MRVTKNQRLKRRHLRVRRKISGTEERPRLVVRKTLKHLYAQVVDDSPEHGSRTLVTFTTAGKKAQGKHMRNKDHAAELGKTVGSELKARGITRIVFDRGGYRYHGCVRNLAESVREAGIEF